MNKSHKFNNSYSSHVLVDLTIQLLGTHVLPLILSDRLAVVLVVILIVSSVVVVITVVVSRTNLLVDNSTNDLVLSV